MSSSRTALPLLLVSGLLGGVARGDTNIWGIPGECQVEVLECSTARDDATRPAPRVLSSVYMQDQRSSLGYVPSPDGRTLLVPLEHGLRLVRDGRRDDYALDVSPRPDPVWHPDSRRVAFWIKDRPRSPKPGQLVSDRRALAVLDVSRLPATPLPAGARVPYQVVYWSSPLDVPFGVRWSPDGQALLVVATELDPDDDQCHGVVTRVPVDPPVGGPSVPLARPETTRELLRVAGQLDFVDGPRAAVAPVTSARLLVGHLGSLSVLGERGGERLELPDVPAAGLFNLAWSPDRRRDWLLVLYRRAVPSPTGELFQGVYLLDLEGALATPPIGPEQLDEATDVHSLWFSPRGTWATWASPEGVWFRAPDGNPSDTVQVTIPAPAGGEAPQVRGFAWSADETKLAITAGNQLYIHEPATQALYPVAERGRAHHTFLAQPTWVGERVVVSSFEDAVGSGRIQVAPNATPPRAR